MKFAIEKRVFIVDTFAFYAAGRFPGWLNALYKVLLRVSRGSESPHILQTLSVRYLQLAYSVEWLYGSWMMAGKYTEESRNGLMEVTPTYFPWRAKENLIVSVQTQIRTNLLLNKILKLYR
jgi:hypothetical protein